MSARRALSSLAIVVTVVLAAGGCSSDDGSDDAGAAEDTTTTTAAEPTEPTEPTTTVVEPEEVAADDVDGFWAEPTPIPEGEPGRLVRYQAAGELAGSPATRIMYTSETVDGRPTVVTGVAFVPEGPAPEGGWPVLTHGHGSTGLADDCAPSRAVGNPDAEVLETAELAVVVGEAIPAGMVVVSSDYEGQGGPGRHPFLVGVSEGRSLLDAARAVAELPGVEVDGRLAIAGYSQGGHAALWAQQVAADWAPELDLVGTLAGAPVTQVVRRVDEAPDGGQGVEALLLVAAVAATDPEIDLDALLTPEGAAVLAALDATCRPDELDVDTTVPMLTIDLTEDETWRDALRANEPGLEAGTGPVLVVHSAVDVNVPLADGEVAIERLCAQGQPAELRVLPEGDHVVAAVPAYQQGVAWLRGLLDGEAPTPTCD